MKRSTKLLWTAGTATLSVAGLIIRIVSRAREKMFEQKFEEQELQILEGEGGICVS